MNAALGQCSLSINTTLPLVCICSLFSFLCGIGIGANDLSANFAMVVGSGSLNMKQAIIYCSVFELLGAAFMGGHVSSTIRNGIVDPTLFTTNRDVVVIGMTAASFAAALWLYLSTVFGLPVSITHTVVGSLLGYAIFATFSFDYVKARGLVVIVVSWVTAPVAACVVTAVIFYFLRRDVFKVKGRSFELAQKVLPACLAASMLVDYAFIIIEKPPIMTQTLAAYVPVPLQLVLLLLLIAFSCYAARRWYFPHVADDARASSSFVWESRAIRTETVDLPPEAAHEKGERLDMQLSFFKQPRPSSSTTSSSSSSSSADQPATGLDREGRGGGRDLSTTASASAGAVPAARATPPPSPGVAERVPLVRRGPPRLDPACYSRDLSVHSSIARGDGRALTGSALVLSSLHASDSRVLTRGMVRLAPTGRRSPLPSVSGREGARAGQASGTFALTSSGGSYGAAGTRGSLRGLPETSAGSVTLGELSSPASVHSEDAFEDSDWELDHPMEPIRFGGLLIKPFNPRAEYLFTSLQVVAGSMSSFVHGAVAGANATATFVVLYDAFTNHELGETDLSSQWSVLPAMLGIAIGMFALGASLMKTVGMELVTVTPARGWCIQVGGTAVTMVLTGLGIPVSLSQSQVGAAIGCGVLDARMAGVSWPLVAKIVGGWVVTLVISATTAGATMWFLYYILC